MAHQHLGYFLSNECYNPPHHCYSDHDIRDRPHTRLEHALASLQQFNITKLLFHLAQLKEMPNI